MEPGSTPPTDHDGAVRWGNQCTSFSGWGGRGQGWAGAQKGCSSPASPPRPGLLSHSPLRCRSCRKAPRPQAPTPLSETRSFRSGPPSHSACSESPRGSTTRSASPGVSDPPGLREPGISGQAFFAFCASQERAVDSTPFVLTNLTSEKGSSPQCLWKP